MSLLLSTYSYFIDLMAPNGVCIVNSDMVTYDPSVRPDVTFIEVPCSSMAQEINHPKGANIIMTGVIAKILGDFTDEEAIDGMNKMFEKKGKGKFAEMNTKAMQLGLNFK